jgi:hypothetical protein
MIFAADSATGTDAATVLVQGEQSVATRSDALSTEAHAGTPRPVPLTNTGGDREKA